MWEVSLTDGKRPDGRPRQRSTTGTSDRATAEQAVAALAAAVRRDLCVRELVGRWLQAQRTSRHAAGFERDRRHLHEVIEPALGDILAADLSAADVERALRPVHPSLEPTGRGSRSESCATPTEGPPNNAGATRTRPPASPSAT